MDKLHIYKFRQKHVVDCCFTTIPRLRKRSYLKSKQNLCKERTVVVGRYISNMHKLDRSAENKERQTMQRIWLLIIALLSKKIILI